MLSLGPGHQGVEGNENVDRLAKEGALPSLYGSEPACGISTEAAKDSAGK